MLNGIQLMYCFLNNSSIVFKYGEYFKELTQIIRRDDAIKK